MITLTGFVAIFLGLFWDIEKFNSFVPTVKIALAAAFLNVFVIVIIGLIFYLKNLNGSTNIYKPFNFSKIDDDFLSNQKISKQQLDKFSEDLLENLTNKEFKLLTNPKFLKLYIYKSESHGCNQLIDEFKHQNKKNRNLKFLLYFQLIFLLHMIIWAFIFMLQ